MGRLYKKRIKIMEKITIISLIYQSVEFAKFQYENILKWTPELQTGEAEFYFIANDATDEVKKFLLDNKYPHYINDNIIISDEESYKLGYAFPEYIQRVYKGYNCGIKVSNNPIVLLINSDMYFSPNWLKNLKSKLSYKNVVTPKVIQPKDFRNPINNSHCINYNCGSNIHNYNEEKFLNKVNEISVDSTSIGNLFMPIMGYKSNFELIGYYPCGNILQRKNGQDSQYNPKLYKDVLYFGDVFLIKKLNLVGIEHITVNNSIIYHLDRGEILNKK
jgi:GT2 family glycosyltransferase